MNINTNVKCMSLKAWMTGSLIVICVLISGCEPSLNFDQLITGFNGPTSRKTWIFHSENETKNSWFRQSLSSSDFQNLLNDIDFEEHVLVAYTAGEHRGATGTLDITKIAYSTGLENRVGFTVYLKLGVNDRGCIYEKSTSYPSAVAVARRPDAKPPYFASGFYLQNFGDGCREPQKGSANDGAQLT